jgi:hypothetical protein
MVKITLKRRLAKTTVPQVQLESQNVQGTKFLFSSFDSLIGKMKERYTQQKKG